MSETTVNQPASPRQLPAKAGPFLILAAALLWSLAGLLVKYIPWHPLAIASGRSLLAALVFAAVYRHACYIVSIGPPSFPVWSLMLTQTGSSSLIR